jgi:hypothetical protein
MLRARTYSATALVAAAPLPNGTSTVVARGSVYFQTNTDYYTYADAANLDLPNSDFAICALVKLTRLTAALTQHIYTHGNTGSGAFVRLYLSNGQLTGQMYDGTNSRVATGATLTVNMANGWYIVGMRRNAGNLEVFSAPVGGTVTVGTGIAVTPITVVAPPIGAFVGGRHDQDAASFFNNHISYLFKLDGALTNADINNLAAGQDIITNLAKSPSLYTKFNTAAATIADSGTGGNTATRVGTPQARGGYAFTGLPVAIDTSANGVDTVYAKVFQRAVGGTSKTLTFTGTYTGSPAGIEARVINSTGTQVVGWTRATTPTVGNWTVTLPNVPQGGQYALEVRHTNNTANIQRTQLPWGVGMVLMVAGESLGDQQFIAPYTGFTPNVEIVSVYDKTNSVWRDFKNNTIGTVVRTAHHLATALGIPVCIGNGATSGSQLFTGAPANWDNPANSTHTKFIAALADVGGDAEAIVWPQGANDANSATALSAGQYSGALVTLAGRLRAYSSRSAANMPFFVNLLSTNQDTGSANNNQYRLVRNEQVTAIGNITNAFDAGSMIDLAHSVEGGFSPHPTNAAYDRLGNRQGQALLNYYASGSYPTSMVGAVPTGAVINGSTIDISYTLNNGTTLQGLTGATGLTGFLVYNGAVSMTATSTDVTISTLTQVAGLATATTSAAHGLTTGQTVKISGASSGFYNGQKTVTVLTSTTFTYVVNASAAASATGTMVLSYATVTATAHGLSTNDVVGVFGATTNEYNIASATVFVVNANTFTYGVDSNAAATATGTITFRKQISITTTAIPTATMVRLTPASTPQTGWLVDYAPGQFVDVTNMLYTNASVVGDAAGVPARAWTATITV